MERVMHGWFSRQSSPTKHLDGHIVLEPRLCRWYRWIWVGKIPA
jgi:hypothetical protein